MTDVYVRDFVAVSVKVQETDGVQIPQSVEKASPASAPDVSVSVRTLRDREQGTQGVGERLSRTAHRSSRSRTSGRVAGAAL